ncbi:MAG: hypothetical protein HY847_02800 [Betaproteobacteria bacterium]|nr:hypothetical protein [Betaproteobacteria bacterium]
MSSPLQDVILGLSGRQAPAPVKALGEVLRQRFGAHVLAVLFYGSCRRSNDDSGGIADLYLLVDDYRAAYGRLLPALANRVLAPNVYYLEIPFAGRTVRAKYAVVSLPQFERGTAHWFHSYLWGRFAQPCGLLYSADEVISQRVLQALMRATVTFVRHAVPRLPAEFDAEDLWTRGLLLSYAAELRPERPGRICAHYADSAGEFTALTRAVAVEQGWGITPTGRYSNPSTRRQRWLSTLSWTMRQAQGKFLSLLRLLKASLTFDGGIAYIAWKIERHSGVKLEITPFMRRFPLLGALGAFWQTWRLGGFR